MKYIDNEKDLKEICKNFKNIIGVDLECENNLHHYGSYITLIQISDKEDYIIDVLALKNIDPLLKVFKDKNIQKIFHDVSFDLRILNHQFNCIPKNIFDTSIAATFLGKSCLGLSSLLKEYFGLEKTKFQKADWTKRPLSNEMLKYAVMDTKYLIKLKEKLCKELEKKGFLEFVKEECSFLEKKDYPLKEQQYYEVLGYTKLSDIERAIFKRLFILRDKLAKKVNRPVHFIISSKRMKEIAKQPPSLNNWKNMTGVHPIVRRFANTFFEEVNDGKKEKIPYERQKPPKYNLIQKQRMTTVGNLREQVANEIKLPKSLVMNKEQFLHICLTGDYDILRPWQKKLFQRFI